MLADGVEASVRSLSARDEPAIRAMVTRIDEGDWWPCSCNLLVPFRSCSASSFPGSYYTCKGNEGASVGVAAAMAPEDVAAPLHRNLGLHLYRGVEPWRVLCQYMGRVGGTTNGRDSNLARRT